MQLIQPNNSLLMEAESFSRATHRVEQMSEEYTVVGEFRC